MKANRTGGMVAALAIRNIGTMAAVTLATWALAVTSRAADWTNAGSGNWNDAGNWSGGVPNGVGATATFTNDIPGDIAVTLDIAPTVGNMFIGDSAATYYSYTLGGANTLTFDDSDTTAGLTVSRGTNNVISVPVALADMLSVQLSNASRIEFSGQLSGTGQLQIGPGAAGINPPNTYVRLSADNSSYGARIRLLGSPDGASPRLEIAHANALGSGDITGVNWYGGWLANVTGSTLTLNNTINGTRMYLHGDPFVLAGDIDLTSTIGMFTYANVTFPNGLPNNLTLVGFVGSTVKIAGASAGDLTISSAANEAFRLEFDDDDGLGPNDGVSLGATLRATLVPLGGPRTVGKSFTAHTWYVDSSENLTLTGDISTSYLFGKAGAGLLVLSGASHTWGTVAQLAGGVFRPETASAIPTSNIRFNGSGGVLELTPATGDFTRSVGTSAGQVQWQNNSGGGFSAYGGDRVVNLGGASAPLTWNLNSFVGNNNALRLSSAHADSVIDFQNPINLRSSNENTLWRNVYVDDNPNSTGDYAVMSGVISNSVSSRGLIKLGPGLLVLTGDNTYSYGTQLQEGTLVAGHANALGTAGTITVYTNATLAVAQGVTFSRAVTFNAGAGLGGLGTFRPAAAWTLPAGFVMWPGLPWAAGTLSVHIADGGDLVLGSGRTVAIDLAGVSADRLVLTGGGKIDLTGGTLALGGTLAGSEHVIVEAAGGIEGTFASVSDPNGLLAGGWALRYKADRVVLARPSGTLIAIR